MGRPPGVPLPGKFRCQTIKSLFGVGPATVTTLDKEELSVPAAGNGNSNKASTSAGPACTDLPGDAFVFGQLHGVHGLSPTGRGKRPLHPRPDPLQSSETNEDVDIPDKQTSDESGRRSL